MLSRRIACVLTCVLVIATCAFGQQAAPDTTMNATMRAQVIDLLAQKLTDSYVFPEAAKKIAASLREHATRKDYDGITSAQAFARRITDDIQSVANDRHLRVTYGAAVPKDATPEELERAALDLQQTLRKRNFGFESVQRLPGNIGYLDLRGLLPVADAGDTAVAAMSFLANCDAVIFDLRRNSGATPDMVDLLISYLYPRGQRVHLNDFRQRNAEGRDQYWTLPYVPGKTLEGKDVYVLISSRTFSGGEEFAYDIQTQKRGTLVGEVTGGGANPGRVVPLTGEFSAFIPFGSAYNPITKTNWEGIGVKPDISVKADDALKAAQLLALRKLAKQDGPPSWKAEVSSTLEQLEKEVGSKLTAISETEPRS